MNRTWLFGARRAQDRMTAAIARLDAGTSTTRSPAAR
jgi:hypothetical protein